MAGDDENLDWLIDMKLTLMTQLCLIEYNINKVAISEKQIQKGEQVQKPWAFQTNFLVWMLRDASASHPFPRAYKKAVMFPVLNHQHWCSMMRVWAGNQSAKETLLSNSALDQDHLSFQHLWEQQEMMPQQNYIEEHWLQICNKIRFITFIMRNPT